MSDDEKKSFEDAGKQRESSLLSEFFLMLKQNKKYWMVPLILVLLGFGVLIMLGGTAVAPFIYQLF
jgi:hypothetical protein